MRPEQFSKTQKICVHHLAWSRKRAKEENFLKMYPLYKLLIATQPQVSSGNQCKWWANNQQVSCVTWTLKINGCRSTPAKPTASPYQNKRHPKTQNKLKLLYYNIVYYIKVQTKIFILMYILTDTYCIRVVYKKAFDVKRRGRTLQQKLKS